MDLLIPHTIRIRIPNARHVAILGDFNHWHSSAHPLVQVGENLWERIVDLPAGKHRYAFHVIDNSTEGHLRSRIVANGAVLYVPATTEESVSITAHPALALHHRPTAPDRLVA